MRGVVVFDIDGTLKPQLGCSSAREGPELAARLAPVNRLMAAARRADFGIGINTARLRVSSRLRDYLLQNFALNVDALPAGAGQIAATSPRREGEGLEGIQRVYGVQTRRNVLFFDDVQSIIDAARAAGFTAVGVAEEKSRDKSCAVVEAPEVRRACNVHAELCYV